MTLLKLFFIFMYIGFFAVGGGLVAATFMQQSLVEQYGLISAEKFYSMLAISESTPGPIGINLATYLGTELFGPLGGIITTIGEVLPSLVVIMIISRFFVKFQDKPIVQSAFSVIRPATSGLILVALVQVIKIALLNVPAFTGMLNEGGAFLDSIKVLFNWQSLVFYELALVILFKTKLHPVAVVAMGAAFGILFL